ncbi:MAG: SDR family oxidoreductase, partial [Planctomycetales bacterium]|nr:SDR family oxidoreductase [Planctomycetales bacterium]
PGHVVGHSKTGVANPGDLLHTIVLSCLQLGVAPAARTEVDVTPVDYVAAAIVELSLQSESFGRNFHLTNPAPLQMGDLVAWMRQMQIDVEFVSDEAWREKLTRLATTVDRDELRMLAEILAPRMLAGDAAGAVHPRFDSSAAQAALAPTDVRCAPPDARLLSACFDYLRRTQNLELAASAFPSV